MKEAPEAVAEVPAAVAEMSAAAEAEAPSVAEMPTAAEAPAVTEIPVAGPTELVRSLPCLSRQGKPQPAGLAPRPPTHCAAPQGPQRRG